MPNTYSTVQGDTWDGIAYKLLGSEGYMHRLIALNPDYAHLVVFPSGVLLNVPEISKPERDRSNLPPWKR